MSIWTVIGYYEDNAQAYCSSIEAADPYQAMGRAAAGAEGDLVIVGAVEGGHTFYAPGEDDISTAYASDLKEQS